MTVIVILILVLILIVISILIKQLTTTFHYTNKFEPPIEVGAQRAVYGKGRSVEQPLVLGALKSNLGHLEGSAGVAGISKVVLTLQKALIPTNLWLHDLNSNIDLSGFPTIMPSELLDWRKVVHRSSVSSFGFSGTNGHAVLGLAPQPEDLVRSEPRDPNPKDN